MALSKEQLTFPLKVSKKIQETEDTYSFQLEIPESEKDKFSYKAGQFVTFFMNINDQEVRRSYSLSSTPQDDFFQVSVKRVANGKGSNYLIDQINEGDKLYTTPPSGHFTLKQHNFSELTLVAAGSGITPVFSLLQESLSTSDRKVSLIYTSRNEENIIFRKKLEELEKKHLTFKVTHYLTQPSGSWSGKTGRLDSPSLIELLKDANKDTEYYLCGPEELMNLTKEVLTRLNIPKEQVHHELFTSPNETTKNDSTASINTEGLNIIGESSNLNTPETIEVLLDGETHQVKYNDEDSILEALLGNSLNPPYSCMDGTCMACMGVVTSGTVGQEDLGILTEENIEANECLTCQAKPLSSSVKIDFDNI